MKTPKSGRSKRPKGRNANLATESKWSVERTLNQRFIAEVKAVIERHPGHPGVSVLSEHFLKKYHDPESSLTAQHRADAAIEKWLSVDDRNRRTNIRLSASLGKLHGMDLDEVISRAASYIQQLIGEEPPADVLLLGTFTGGASTAYPKGFDVMHRKFAHPSNVTEDAVSSIVPLAGAMTWYTYTGYFKELEQVAGSVMFTVPKSALIDRVAAKEPEFNMYAQRACGIFIRERLRRVGIDLQDQGVNQSGAAKAFKEGLATIDLSSASDSISTMLVSRLLPPSWFVLLDSLRSKKVAIPNREELYEPHMFSSMGNGFTFELETTIFWSLARAIASFKRIKGRISVYGDDIIVTCQLARYLRMPFLLFGFQINGDKSHWKISDTYRESCGKHYAYVLTDLFGVEGVTVEVTPFYLREPIKDQAHLMLMLNHLKAWDSRYSFPIFGEVWRKFSRFVDKRFYGGRRLESDAQLVTGHLPRFRLVRDSKEHYEPSHTSFYVRYSKTGQIAWSMAYTSHGRGTRDEVGAYLSKLREIAERKALPEELSGESLTETLDRLVIRRAIPAHLEGYDSPFFHWEVGSRH